MSGQVTRILAEWRNGDAQAVERLVPLVYDELRHLAGRQLRREAPGHTLSATALVHEVYLRLLRQHQLSATALVHEVYLRLLRQHQLSAVDRDGFLAIAAATMRRILVDHARTRQRLKRGGRQKPQSLEPDAQPVLLTPVEMEEVLAIDIALERLAERDQRAWRVVECRIFGGLTLEETARALDLSTKSVQRSWTAARAWLRKEIGPSRVITAS